MPNFFQLTASLAALATDVNHQVVGAALSGNTSKLGTVSGTITPLNCLEWDASGNITGTGAGCASGGGNTLTTPLDTMTIGGTSTASTIDAKLPYFVPDQFPGVTCDDTNQAAAIDSMLATVCSLGGGVIQSRPGQFCRHVGVLTWPGGVPHAAGTCTVYWKGCGPEGSGEWGDYPSAGCALTVTGSDSLGLIQMTSVSSGGPVDMAIRDDADCSPMMWLQATTVHLGHTSFKGWKSRPNACNDAIVAGTTDCHTDDSKCYTAYRSDGEVYGENIRQILIGGGDFATNDFGLWGSSTDSNMSGGVPVGPFVTLDGGNASNKAAQNKIRIYAEVGSPNGYVGVPSSYTSVVALDYAGSNTIETPMVDDDGDSPEPTAVYTTTTNTKNAELHCNYYHYLNFPCRTTSSWNFANTWYDPQRGVIQNAKYMGISLGNPTYDADGDAPFQHLYLDSAGTIQFGSTVINLASFNKPQPYYGFAFQGAVGASATGLQQAQVNRTVPANFTTPTTVCKCGTNPASSFALTLKDGASTLGTLTLDSSCALTAATTGGTTQSITAGDQLYLIAPGSADATAANITCNVLVN